MLKISNLNANVENKSILKGFSLNINPAESVQFSQEEKDKF